MKFEGSIDVREWSRSMDDSEIITINCFPLVVAISLVVFISSKT